MQQTHLRDLSGGYQGLTCLSNWMAQRTSGSRQFTQAHTALPVKVTRVSSLKWMGFVPTALGYAKPVKMVRHEDAKKVVAALMRPVAEELMRLTDACWNPFLMSGASAAAPALLSDAGIVAFTGALATRLNSCSVFSPPPHIGVIS